ncbi:MAG: hypothetical protein FJ313_00780 [Gemmatimonadetes bacterium]|nr:hypothetical protein [Gemmatimonadota bacterium]
MPSDEMQYQSFDVYADQFTVTLSPFGANLSFAVREPHPAPARAPQSRSLGTVRMSVEHLKSMVFILRRHIQEFERGSNVRTDLPRSVLNQLNIPVEDWDSFWY